jgi:uncharacterized protein
MKFLLVLIVVVVLLWLMFGRRRGGGTAARKPGAPAEPAAMIACAHCGVHLPRSDAVGSGAQWFCSEAHRLAGPR